LVCVYGFYSMDGASIYFLASFDTLVPT
jgi:hypothetical protein